MTNAPTPGWYQDPEMAGRLRYWDGSQWTEHLAGAPNLAPSYQAPTPPMGYYQPQGQQHITLFNNPYRLPPRTPRRAVEASLSSKERVQAALVDTALVIPFIVIGFCISPVLSWISGDGPAKDHAYYGAGLVLSLALGIAFVFWNFVIRETTVGTDVMGRLQKKPDNSDSSTPTSDDDA